MSSGTDLQKSRHVLKSLSLCNKVLSYLSLYIYIETDRQTDRQTETERERDRDRDTETERVTHRDRDTQRQRQRYRERETETDRDRDRQTEDVPLVGFMYLAFTRIPDESYRRRFRSLLLCLCDV